MRKKLGIEMRGRGTFSNSATIYFKADVAPLLRGRNLSVIYVTNSTLRGFFRIEKPFNSGFLAINALGDPKNPIADVYSGLTESRCKELVRVALGVDDIPVGIEGVMPWKAEADVADRFQSGRIFLAGDSAHVMPPNGGFGGNTGVQDAHNLAWKLTRVLQGKAGTELLATYEPERRPVAQFTAEQAYSRYVTRTAPYLGIEGIQPVENDLNVELGYCYEGKLHENPRESKGRPGSRAPHYWLERDGTRISTLDLLGRDFVLLGGPQARSDASSVEFHRIGANGLTDPEGRFCDAYGIEATGTVLVRPDGFVAERRIA
jgi:hypothetical protein